jgi:hypothetical protein
LTFGVVCGFVLLLEHQFLLPLGLFVVPCKVLDEHLHKDDQVRNNDFKNNWGPPNAALFPQVEVSWDHHQAHDEKGADKYFGVLFELEL